MFRRVLVPVDFTKRNARAVKIAAKVASSRGASLTLLHVIERVDAGDDAALAGFYRGLEKNARTKMGPLLAAAGKVPTHAEIVYGNRVDEVLRLADENRADLIVMGSHRVDRKHPGQNWGTISYKIGILARCPVLLVK
jgi:nucleotide-binding universal stress UspA family protein